jgi:hypothetical protein
VTPPPNGFIKDLSENFEEALRKIGEYPCKECKSTIPYCYCTPCRAEFDKRNLEKSNQENASARQGAREYTNPPTLCAACGEKFKDKRKDAKFCSNACGQRAHRSCKGKAAAPALAVPLGYSFLKRTPHRSCALARELLKHSRKYKLLRGLAATLAPDLRNFGAWTA